MIVNEDAFDKVTFRSPCTLLTDDVETVVKEPVFVLAFAIIEGSLEVKLPTIWTVEKQR